MEEELCFVSAQVLSEVECRPEVSIVPEEKLQAESASEHSALSAL